MTTLAIHKPTAISSAQVIRDVQQHFNPSDLFKSWLMTEQARLRDASHNQRQKRRSWKSKQPLQVKMGHGGTLDPLATGVLILGVGSGTKSLNGFLECTKSYECVLLFGAATDTYDSEGKVVARKPYEHVKREKVEIALDQFRGKIMQRPPIFSALRVQGKRLYDYAREGKEVPVEIKERPVEVKELEVVEWMEGGTHQWRWPQTEAGKEEKEVVDKVLHLETETETETAQELDPSPKPVASTKRTRDEEDETSNGAVEPSGPLSPKRPRSLLALNASGALPGPVTSNDKATTQGHPTEQPIPTAEPGDDRPPCPAPAVRLRMTCTSGFYVRSLCHDLGAALGSLGIMASLVRTRQGDFELGTNVLQYEDLARGEDVWGPQVKKMLLNWHAGTRESGGKTVSGTPLESKELNDAMVKRGELGQKTKVADGTRARRNTSSEED